MASVHFDNETAEAENAEPGNEAPEVNSHVSRPTKRQRWATTRVTGAGGTRRRVSIMDRLHKRSTMGKRKSAASSLPSENEENGNNENDESNGDSGDSRKVYFNTPIPESERDDEGRPTFDYPKNKVRTAKYTPLTFVPKNLWLQFHNIANMYFLFVIILNVCPLLSPAIANAQKLTMD